MTCAKCGSESVVKTSGTWKNKAFLTLEAKAKTSTFSLSKKVPFTLDAMMALNMAMFEILKLSGKLSSNSSFCNRSRRRV